MHRAVAILVLAVLAIATVVSPKPWLTPKRLIYRTHVLRLDDALARVMKNNLHFPTMSQLNVKNLFALKSIIRMNNPRLVHADQLMWMSL
ncbi:hypothetical protein Pla52n_56540 [Stieleria varia]|uniref:Uncharacterized protein n=1 Tax=Stieleria varia TaxID=2528005 RepID=A0A5C6A348_9BACT|nr:hypothetical protein Pla52n_56540 [Stieleria varia]